MMSELNVPFAPPRIDDLVVDSVASVLRSGWITTGPKTKEFERRIADFVGVPRVVCLNSATAGMEMALRWWGIGPGDEVILPAYTYCSTANVIVHCGAKPVFVDVQDDFNIDPKAVEKAITSKSKAIMPVDIGGFPVDYDQLNAVIETHKGVFEPSNHKQEKLGRILLLADTAHSLGAYYKGQNSGQLADLSSFSFHAVKNLSTAEGGALCINLPETFDAEEVYREIVVKSLHGQSKDALAKTQAGSWKYDIVEPGFKCNMTDIQAAIGLVELERYRKDTLEKRRYVFDRYSKAFENESWAQIPTYKTEEKLSSFHVYMLRLSKGNEDLRDRVIQYAAEQKVALNVHFIPVPALSAYRQLGYHEENYPITLGLYATEISLPVFYDISDAQIDRVVEVIKSAVKVLG